MKFALAIVLLAAVAFADNNTDVYRYNDHSVYRLRPSNETQLRLVQKLEDQNVYKFLCIIIFAL